MKTEAPPSLRPPGGSAAELDLEVPSGGYAWWYIDALSDDGRYGLTLIAFIGSVFSPYYFESRRRGRQEPRDHVSINVCLYGERRRWTMTERSSASLEQTHETLAIGPSQLHWSEDSGLIVTIDEVGTPIPQRVRGRIQVRPHFINNQVFTLDDAGRHRWRPVAPSARIDVDLDKPELHWSGHAYFDRNWGDEQIEDGFSYWDWSRGELGEQESVILYNMARRKGGTKSMALRFSPDGVEPFEPPADHRLPRTPIWQMPRSSQADAEHPPSVVRTLEDTPFYSRSVINTHLLGKPLQAVHESLSLNRFRSPVVQFMLPYRMPRHTG